MVPRCKVQSPGGLRTYRSAAFVIRGRVDRDCSRVPGTTSLQAEIEILEGEEVVFVEQTGGFDGLSTNQHHTAAHPVDAVVRQWVVERRTLAGTEIPHPSASHVV